MARSLCADIGSSDPALDLRALRQDVGIVFQSYNLFPHLTIEENIMLAPCSVKRTSKAQAKEQAQRGACPGRARRTSSTHIPNSSPAASNSVSAIARSLAMQPKVMLFDEVTSALDPELTGEVLKVIEALAAGRHDHGDGHARDGICQGLADRVVFMHRGKVHETGRATILSSPATPELAQFVGTGL